MNVTPPRFHVRGHSCFACAAAASSHAGPPMSASHRTNSPMCPGAIVPSPAGPTPHTRAWGYSREAAAVSLRRYAVAPSCSRVVDHGVTVAVEAVAPGAAAAFSLPHRRAFARPAGEGLLSLPRSMSMGRGEMKNNWNVVQKVRILGSEEWSSKSTVRKEIITWVKVKIKICALFNSDFIVLKKKKKLLTILKSWES